MVDGCQGTGPVRVRRADVVIRGLGYGALGGLVTGVLLVVVIGTFSAITDGAQGVIILPVYAMFAAVLGAIVGSVVGLFGGVVFAVAAPCLQRHRALAVVAGLAVPAGFLAVVCAGLALRHVATLTPVFADSAGLAQWTRSTLVEWAVTAPAGGLLARRVLYGRHIPPKDRAE